ncbi:MAG: hypothetical protein IIA65_10260 [Planctomycetes bacterium]|nr:hypothetical protein [Planctomycetota bacterium]
MVVWGASSSRASYLESVWDPALYIDINEISPGMRAYCLTCFDGTDVEQFDLDVVSVMRNYAPGHDANLVKGTDERFLHTGPVAGCSGSPVMVEGRLAGALAFAWPLSTDPLYGVTPIREMLGIGTRHETGSSSSARHGVSSDSLPWDFREPIDLSRFAEASAWSRRRVRLSPNFGRRTLVPLMVSGIPAQAVADMQETLTPLGLQVVAHGGRAPINAAGRLLPGATLVLPLVRGDIELAAFGTVTEVRGNKVFGFGHDFLGLGAVDFPMATGYVHTVVSNLQQSFKLGSTLDVVGALRFDEPTGIVGLVGETARTLPVRLTVRHINSVESRHFQCRLAYHKLLTPQLLKATIEGAVRSLGGFPPEHTVLYEGVIRLQGGRHLRIANVSTNNGLREFLGEGLGSLMLLMNNPFGEVPIEEVELSVEVVAQTRVARISSLSVSDLTVRPGETIRVGVVVESYHARKEAHSFEVTVPRNIAEGEYELTVCGPYDYAQHLRRVAPHRMLALNLSSLVDALEYVLSLRRDRLFCLFELPANGVTVERTELPGLPATKSLVLQSTKRTVRIVPYVPWLETRKAVSVIVSNKHGARIVVKK